jgi:hypothetical protein
VNIRGTSQAFDLREHFLAITAASHQRMRLTGLIINGALGDHSREKSPNLEALSLFTGWLQQDSIFNRVFQLLLAAEVALSGLHRYVAEQKLNLFQFSASEIAQPGAGSSKVVGRQLGDSNLQSSLLDDQPTTLSVSPSLQTRPNRSIARKIRPLHTLAADAQRSTEHFTHVGTGTVRA